MIEVNLPRLTRAMSHMGAALDELREAAHGTDPRIVRLHTEDRVVDLPLPSLVIGAIAGLAVVAVRIWQQRPDTASGGAEPVTYTVADGVRHEEFTA